MRVQPSRGQLATTPELLRFIEVMEQALGREAIKKASLTASLSNGLQV